MNRCAALKTSTEPTFPVFVTYVDQVGRLGMPLASPIFCRFFKTIHDPLSEIPCPLGPNVNSWSVLGASREPTFPFNVTCVGQVGRLGMPLASLIFCVHRTHISRFRDLCGSGGQTGHTIGFPYFLPIFKTIHDPLSEIPCPLGPNVNSWAVLGASREPTFPFNVTCVGTMGRLGMPLASPIFC